VREPAKEPKLHAGVTVGAPPLTETAQAGVTVMDPGMPEENMHAGVTAPPVPPVENMQDGVTVSVPTVAAVKEQMLVHAACRPILKVLAVGVPHTNAPNDSSCAALVIPVQPLIVKEAVPATNVRGAPTVKVPTAAVRKPVPVLIFVTAIGAAWVVI